MFGVIEGFVNGSMVVFGLIWGSYLNVVVYRVPRGLSTAVPSSHCPRCSVRIRSFDNVPVLSWVLLRARCRSCKGTISARYPLVESAVGAAFLLGFHRFERPVEILVAWVLACVLLALVLIDYDRRLVPLVLVVPMIVAGWALQPLLHWAPLGDAVLASILGAALVLGAAKLWQHLCGEVGLGAGDAYVLALIGAIFGVDLTLRVLAVALVAAGCASLLLVVWTTLAAWSARRFGHKLPLPPKSLPMASFLGLAALWFLLFDSHGPGTAALLL